MDKLKWLYLDLNSFFASCEQQENPKLKNVPLAVLPLMAETTSCLAASYPAKKFGVKTGTKVADARKMCPGIQFVLARHDIYVKYHHKIIEAVETCVPVHSVRSIDELCIELTGSQQQEEVAVALAKKIKNTLKEKVGDAITCSIGISTNPFIAKMATDMQKPDGLTIIHKKELPQKLYSLKLTDILGVGPRMEQRLWGHNIRTVEKLCSLSSQDFKTIWGGVWGERIHLLLQGIEVDLPQTKNKSMSHQHVMPPDKRNTSGALEIAKKLLIKLAVRLRKNNFYTKNLHVSIRFIDQGPDPYWERHLTFTEVRDTHTLLKYLENLWKTYPKNKKPLRISITFSDLVRQNSHQFSFFENPKNDQVSVVMDKINQKYGKNTVQLGASHQQKEAAPTRIAFSRIPELDEFDSSDSD